MRLVLVLVGALCLVVSLTSADVEFNNPVRTAQEDLVNGLPGLNYDPGFNHYSGYLEADDANPTNRFWHYWFVESQSNPDGTPLVLWLNGGPGCSSLLGLLTEQGPFRVGPNNTIVRNDNSWNKFTNMIFMESPAGVGFSYAVDGSIDADDDTTAKQNHIALRSFLKKFPKYKDSPLYLTGESYGGVYLPTLAVLVDDDKEMNLKGVAIGNGYLNANKLAESLIYFSYYHGLFGASVWKGISKHCCNGKTPARDQCQFSGEKVSQNCNSFVVQVTDNILNSGMNPYNLYDHCYSSDEQKLLNQVRWRSVRQIKGREHFDKSMMLSAFNMTSKKRPNTFGKLMALGGDPPCTDDSIVINYLNRPEVKSALHIPRDLKTQFTTCFDGIKYTMIYPGQTDGLAPQVRKLIQSERKLNLLVYNGDVDMMCNFMGDEWFVDDLKQKVVKDFHPWYTNRQVSGFSKVYEGITYKTVKGSGHMVPTDKPAEAYQMFSDFINEVQS